MVGSTAKEDNNSKRKKYGNQFKLPSSSIITNPKNDTIVDRQQQSVRYEYMKLKDVQRLFPLASKKLVSIYGIIVSYTVDGIMIIKDETDRLRFYHNLPINIVTSRLTTTIEAVNADDSPSITNENDGFSYKTGDIIRIHRLTLNCNFMHRAVPRNVVVSHICFNFDSVLINFLNFTP